AVALFSAAHAAEPPILVGEREELRRERLARARRVGQPGEGVARSAVRGGLLLPGLDESAQGRAWRLPRTLFQHVPSGFEPAMERILDHLPVVVAGLRAFLRLDVRDPALDPSLHGRLFFSSLLRPLLPPTV